MGLMFDAVTLDGKFDRAAVTVLFAELREQSRNDFGRRYSGKIGMAAGLQFADQPGFAGQREADEWIAGMEWGNCAIAVRFRRGEVEDWRIGAWCSW
jgi:hypothetical protein